jgi:anti-sigma regulatory factor (Ser/Thr protein kinase)
MLRRKKHLAMVDGTEYPYTHSITLTSPEDGFDAVYSLLEKVWIDASNVETIDRLGFETALIELVSNVFQHGDSDITPLCTVTVKIYSDRIECSLLDAGTPRDLQLTGRSMPDEFAESGRGIILIQALVDELNYAREGDRNRWHMVKKTARAEFSPETVPQVLRPRPIDEAVRQQALNSLNLLDTAPEERFDLITRLAQRLFGVETCAISLIDNDRQWFKSKIGLADAETSRSVAFCDYTIRQYDTMVVPDARLDPRFQANPLVTGDPNIRFYAGYPIEAGNDQPVGALCVFDPNPRIFTEEEKDLLRDLALYVQNELLAAQDLDRAREVQRGLSPKAFPDMDGYEIAGVCLPSQAVGGDFYDWYQVQDRMALTLADVMGKGIGSAIIAATVRAVFRAAFWQDDIDMAMETAAAILKEDLSTSGKFVTFFHARLHKDTGSLEYIDAGHGLTSIVRADGRVDQLASQSFPLGLHMDEPWIVETETLEIGDTLVSVSDGVLDLFDGTLSGLLQATAIVQKSTSAQAVVDALEKLAAPQSAPDDVTILVLRRTK